MKKIYPILIFIILFAYWYSISLFNTIHKQNEQTIFEQKQIIETAYWMAQQGDFDALDIYLRRQGLRHFCACVIFTEGMIKVIDGKMYRYIHGVWKLIPKYNFVPKRRSL